MHAPASTTAPYFKIGRLRARWFYISLVSGPLLLIAMFLPWFATTELSIFFGVVGLGLIGFNGFISPPGFPSSEVHIRAGLPIALVAMAGITYAAAVRARSHQTRRKPPGTL
jgi:hypothetical protein